SFDHDIAASLSGVSVHLPAPSRPHASRRGNPVLALHKLAAREWDAALVEADRAVAGDPNDPLPRAVRALARLASGQLTASQDDVLEAHRLSLGDPDLGSLLIRVLEYSVAVMQESRIAAKSGTEAVVGAESKE